MTELMIPDVIKLPDIFKVRGTTIEQIKLFMVGQKDGEDTVFGIDHYGFIRGYQDLHTIAAVDTLSNKPTIFQLLAEFCAQEDDCASWFKNKFRQGGVTCTEVLEQVMMEDLGSARLLGAFGYGAELTVSQVKRYYLSLML